MRREIKFRAWNHHLNRMMVVDSIRLRNVLKPFVCEESYYSKDEIELMQYTGLKDKDGKEIYEGDILRSFTPNRGSTGAIIDYDDEFIIVHDIRDIKEQLMFMLEPVVVGNIFETSELVKP